MRHDAQHKARLSAAYARNFDGSISLMPIRIGRPSDARLGVAVGVGLYQHGSLLFD